MGQEKEVQLIAKFVYWFVVLHRLHFLFFSTFLFFTLAIVLLLAEFAASHAKFYSIHQIQNATTTIREKQYQQPASELASTTAKRRSTLKSPSEILFHSYSHPKIILANTVRHTTSIGKEAKAGEKSAYVCSRRHYRNFKWRSGTGKYTKIR